MGVPCPRCGRLYDATLFPFGRTLWCTCGGRVGLESRIVAAPESAEKRFIADAMLGRLARWLRLLGFDCVYQADIPDEALIQRGVQEKRIILSRDRRLAEEWRVSGIHLLRSEDLGEQLAELFGRFGLANEMHVLSRCSECNLPLRTISTEQVSGRVPARVLRTHEAFRECVGCRRVYWEGTHTERIRRIVDRFLAEMPHG